VQHNTTDQSSTVFNARWLNTSFQLSSVEFTRSKSQPMQSLRSVMAYGLLL